MLNLGEEVELDGPPAFELEQKVRVRTLIRNDGTYPGESRGTPLVHPGEEGYVIGIGTFLQQSYVYSVHFLKIGRIIGCLKRELELVDEG